MNYDRYNVVSTKTLIHVNDKPYLAHKEGPNLNSETYFFKARLAFTSSVLLSN